MYPEAAYPASTAVLTAIQKPVFGRADYDGRAGRGTPVAPRRRAGPRCHDLSAPAQCARWRPGALSLRAELSIYAESCNCWHPLSFPIETATEGRGGLPGCSPVRTCSRLCTQSVPPDTQSVHMPLCSCDLPPATPVCVHACACLCARLCICPSVLVPSAC